MRPSHRPAGPAFLDAIKVPAGAFKPGAAVTYMVVEKKAQAGEKRAEMRKRTRLRSGKILDTKNKFLIECQVHDRSPQGARLRLVANVSAPSRIRLFDDESKIVRDARVVWRNNQELGVRFMATIKADALRPADRAALDGNKYYAVS
jgi:hypothetical protein